MPLPTIPSGNVASALPTGYNIDNSCRFNLADSSYVHKTQGTSTDTDKYTLSVWLKRGSNLGAVNSWFSEGTGLTAQADYNFSANGTMMLYNRDASSNIFQLVTNRVFRDVSAWYHIVLLFDSSQGVAANRMKLYINGVQETSFSTATYPAQDLNSEVNKGGTKHTWGAFDSNGSIVNEFDGYIAEALFLDGTVAAIGDLGEFDEDSPTIWKPKDVSGLTFGTNGYYLDFEDSSNLGNDANGGTDFTEVNLAAADQATDTPTNNFCTLNPLAAANNQPTFSEGNCQAVSGGGWYGNLGTFAVSAGKWYWEVKNTSTGGNFHGVIADYVDFDDATVYNEVGATSYSKDDGGEVHYGADTTTADYGSTDQNDILGIALNMDDKQISFYDNGSAIVSNFALDDATNLDFVIPFAFEWSATVQYNFGGCSAFALSSAAQDENGYGNFEYAPPSGYLALCTKNLGSDGG